MNKDYVCKMCGGTEYYREKDGHRRCRECTKDKMRKIYATKEYKEKHRIQDRRRRRNCTREEYETALAAQGGKCAICGKQCDRDLRADHSHTTGKFRALLCDNCNWGIGNFKDDQELLAKSIEYLKQHNN